MAVNRASQEAVAVKIVDSEKGPQVTENVRKEVMSNVINPV